AARAVGYLGAGTVEFIAEQDGRFYFMEMNTRLQVEHPVTEAVTCHDLVEWQLRVAAGEPLPATQEQLALRGHAIEARICAENPQANFLPATGTLEVVRWPGHVAFARNACADAAQPPAPVRLDAGFGEGDAISPWYDSMVAKLIVWGEDRAQALARLRAALAQTRLVGLNTNVAFLHRVACTRAFTEADLDTALIERERAALFEAPGLPPRWAVAGAIALRLSQERAQQGDDPWSRRDGWRLSGAACRRLDFEVQGQHHPVRLERSPGGGCVMQIGQERLALTAEALADASFDVTLGGERRLLEVHAAGARCTVFAGAERAEVSEFDLLAHAGDGAVEGRLSAPMPGKVLSIAVAAGQAVRRGQALAVMEAMKMEHTVHAPRDGVVAELLVAAGEQVAEGAELLRLQP
ncbi:MAG: biotin/lipoyl-containing protein, partial [Rubrivivax sp.]